MEENPLKQGKVPVFSGLYKELANPNVVLWISCFVHVDKLLGDPCIKFFAQNFLG
jgi:hypothetical protein